MSFSVTEKRRSEYLLLPVAPWGVGLFCLPCWSTIWCLHRSCMPRSFPTFILRPGLTALPRLDSRFSYVPALLGLDYRVHRAPRWTEPAGPAQTSPAVLTQLTNWSCSLWGHDRKSLPRLTQEGGLHLTEEIRKSVQEEKGSFAYILLWF